jgi:hypothetical protein
MLGMGVAPSGCDPVLASSSKYPQGVSTMKPKLLNHPFHNPFYNRFNDPVRRRVDDLQAHDYTVWLKERNRVLPPKTNNSDGKLPSEIGQFGGILAGSLVLVVVALFSVAVFWKAL